MISLLHKAKVLLWGKTPEDPKEAKLLVKIDWFVLSFACLLYWVNYVDRLNISNAYVSGMQEDLDMKGNEFNLINTCFTIGYIVFLVPHNLILLRIRPRYWLSFCSIVWAFLTLGVYKVHSFQQICVLRFFQGAFEASTFVGVHLILGSWYKEDELTKRSAIFTSAGLIGNIFSSTMQAAIYTSMNGKNGIAGWRWLFIIDFVITIPIAVYGFIFFPDTPNSCKAFYFSKEEIELAQNRVNKPEIAKLDWSLIKRVLGSWHWWLFSFLWVLGGENESFATNSLFALWLKFYNYTVPQRNHYPMGVYAVGVLATFTFALYVDGTGAKYHWRVGIFIAICMLISTILLLTRPLSGSFVFAAHYLSGVSYAGQATFFAYANVVCKNDLAERAVVLASMNMFSNAVNAWWSLLFYVASDAPKFRKGCIAMICTTVSSVIVVSTIRYLQLREERLATISNGDLNIGDDEKSVESTSKKDSTVVEVKSNTYSNTDI